MQEGDRIFLVKENDRPSLKIRSGQSILKGLAPTIANVDGQGWAEVIIGDYIYVLEASSTTTTGNKWVIRYISIGSNSDARKEPDKRSKRSVGSNSDGTNNLQGSMNCVHDLDSDGTVEVIVGLSAYHIKTFDNTEQFNDACSDDRSRGKTCKVESELVWQLPNQNSGFQDERSDDVYIKDGFCAVADVWGRDTNDRPGPDNLLDQKPEVILIYRTILVVIAWEKDGTGKFTPSIIHKAKLSGDGEPFIGGGAPNVDDFDGDGFPEVATALASRYVVYDFQQPSLLCPAFEGRLGDNSGLKEYKGHIDGNDEDSDTSNNIRFDDKVDTREVDSPPCEDDRGCTGGTFCYKQKGETQGACRCYHNGWARFSEDDSSKVTSSSVFDFNGDGVTEAIHNDECYLYVYNGLDARLLFRGDNPTRTALENPVVADVDRDGAAEIIIVSNTESGSVGIQGCSLYREDANGNQTYRFNRSNGVKVYGSQGDHWTNARAIYNQQSYHVTNVFESGRIPMSIPPSWVEYQGRVYNSYRSQPKTKGIAPDLEAIDLTFSSINGDTCSGDGDKGDQAIIEFTVQNSGDERGGEAVEVVLDGKWEDGWRRLKDASDQDLSYSLMSSLRPGQRVMGSVEYDVGWNKDKMILPSRVRITVDPVGSNGEAGRERECNEDNNQREADIELKNHLPDFKLTLGEHVCREDGHALILPVIYENEGASLVSQEVTVFIYGGDPPSPSNLLHKVTVNTDTDRENIEIPNFPGGSINLFAVIDANEELQECRETNNIAEAIIECWPILR